MTSQKQDAKSLFCRVDVSEGFSKRAIIKSVLDKFIGDNVGIFSDNAMVGAYSKERGLMFADSESIDALDDLASFGIIFAQHYAEVAKSSEAMSSQKKVHIIVIAE